MLIALNGISKSYQASHGAPPYQVLKDANLSIDKGEMVAIKGSSGAGKSTLLHIIGCLDKPTSGSYLLNGQDVSQLSLSKLAEIRNASFGFVMQHFALIEEDNALQNVATPLLFAKARRSQMDARAMEQLRNVGMEQMANKRIATLSGGERQSSVLPSQEQWSTTRKSSWRMSRRARWIGQIQKKSCNCFSS